MIIPMRTTLEHFSREEIREKKLLKFVPSSHSLHVNRYIKLACHRGQCATCLVRTRHRSALLQLLFFVCSLKRAAGMQRPIKNHSQHFNCILNNDGSSRNGSWIHRMARFVFRIFALQARTVCCFIGIRKDLQILLHGIDERTTQRL